MVTPICFFEIDITLLEFDWFTEIAQNVQHGYPLALTSVAHLFFSFWTHVYVPSGLTSQCSLSALTSAKTKGPS